MERHTKNWDVIIRLCIAGHFSLLEVNRALKLYGLSELYAKEPRDACIIVALNNRIYDLGQIDDILTEHGLTKTPQRKNRLHKVISSTILVGVFYRLVFRIGSGSLEIAQCKTHYEDN